MVNVASTNRWVFEPVAGPFAGTTMGGVAWDGEAVLFSLVTGMQIKRFDPASGRTDTWRKYTGRANGLAIGRDGCVYAAQEGGRRVIQYLPDGGATTTGLRLDGRIHNHPCDLVLDSRLRIWFADPYSEMLSIGPQIFPKLDHASVLRAERDERNNWTLRRITSDTAAPRSVLLSPDEKTLYVAEGDKNTPLRELRSYPVRSDGTVATFSVLHTFGRDHAGPHRGIEGMALAQDGSVVACAGGRNAGPGPMLYVFSASGQLVAGHPFPADAPVRCAFGGKNLNELYVTSADGHLYRARNLGLLGYTA
jgi:gluconolactonase